MTEPKLRIYTRESRLYYLCDTRPPVISCESALFWKKDRHGYTTDIDEAEVFTEEEAYSLHEVRETDVPYPKDLVDALAKRQVNKSTLLTLE